MMAASYFSRSAAFRGADPFRSTFRKATAPTPYRAFHHAERFGDDFILLLFCCGFKLKVLHLQFETATQHLNPPTKPGTLAQQVLHF
jgi:hypothetical protein